MKKAVVEINAGNKVDLVIGLLAVAGLSALGVVGYFGNRKEKKKLDEKREEISISDADVKEATLSNSTLDHYDRAETYIALSDKLDAMDKCTSVAAYERIYNELAEDLNDLYSTDKEYVRAKAVCIRAEYSEMKDREIRKEKLANERAKADILANAIKTVGVNAKKEA